MESLLIDAECLVVQCSNWAKTHDLPNWGVVLFTGIVWPLVLFYWHRRKVNNIRHLDVRLQPTDTRLNGESHPAVGIEFINHTGSVVYLTDASIEKASSLFFVPIAASKDMVEGSRPLSFNDGAGNLNRREVTLQTNETARTSLAITSPLPEAFYNYRAPWYRQALRWRKYFILEYTVMVGTARYSVATLY